ncbi:hypothetical protein GWE18_40055 [Bradyrhizobium sp. CSA112]|uniref:hypothetical protein n=1 Tax=Bradyrhizobium sp. CSA112 TaxID=2699170 RepID=UPI0023B09B8C|nr:hypothetical protein [Bradyrhizobium sp. CSA112]MDE5458823.1 hypothetical protein [Bradyrhizobium sp. CSA112]
MFARGDEVIERGTSELTQLGHCSHSNSHVLVASPPPSLRRRDLHQEIHGGAHARGSRKIAVSDEQQVD